MWRMLERQLKTTFVVAFIVEAHFPEEDHLWQENAGLLLPMGILGRIRLFSSEEDAAFYRLARM